MFVILDTSAINLDDDLSNPDLDLLLSSVGAASLVVCIPEVVVLEMVTHRKRRIESAQRDLENAREKLGGFLSRDVPTDVTAGEVDDSVAKFETEFRTLLQARGMRVIGMPAAASDIRVLLARDFANRKPFNSGRGMRDALIWESVLELCAGETRPLALITKNTKDFADPSGDLLHSDLRADLEAVGFPPDDAELHQTIRGFNEARLKSLEAPTEPGQVPPPPDEAPQPEEPEPRPESTPPEAGIPPGIGEPAVALPPEHTPEDQFILQNTVSESRKKDFFESFVADRKQTAIVEALFKQVSAFRRTNARPNDVNSTGFNVLIFKGPFVEGSNWLPHSSWDFAVAMERDRLGRLEHALREATEGRLGTPVNREATAVLEAFNVMGSQLELRGYVPSVFVLAGRLGMQLAVDLRKRIVDSWDPEVKGALGTTFRILGMHRGNPILDVPDTAAPAVYAVDLARFAMLTGYGEEPECAIEEITPERATELLSKNPRLVLNPPPGFGMDEERIRQLRLRVGLQLWETCVLTVADGDAVLGCRLVGPAPD